jgi:hypothetical protein
MVERRLTTLTIPVYCYSYSTTFVHMMIMLVIHTINVLYDLSLYMFLHALNVKYIYLFIDISAWSMYYHPSLLKQW